MKTKCVNPDCPEYGIEKDASNFPPETVIACGECLRTCENVVEPEPEVNPQ